MSPDTARLIDPAVREWRADTRPIGMGTRFHIRGRLGRLPISGTSQVIAWDPPTFAEFRSVAPTWPFRMTARHQSDQHPGGGTDYTWTISFHGSNIVTRPLSAISARLFKQAFAAQADALTRYLDKRMEDELPPSL